MAMAKFHLSATNIKAPSGPLTESKKARSLIDEGELLTSLSDNSEMFAYFNVSEPEYLDYETDIKNRAQNQVGLLLANGVPLKYKGTVEVIESEFNRNRKYCL
jgi:membrane fusion protein (multidrug efflux system)